MFIFIDHQLPHDWPTDPFDPLWLRLTHILDVTWVYLYMDFFIPESLIKHK